MRSVPAKGRLCGLPRRMFPNPSGAKATATSAPMSYCLTHISLPEASNLAMRHLHNRPARHNHHQAEATRKAVCAPCQIDIPGTSATTAKTWSSPLVQTALPTSIPRGVILGNKGVCVRGNKRSFVAWYGSKSGAVTPPPHRCSPIHLESMTCTPPLVQTASPHPIPEASYLATKESPDTDIPRRICNHAPAHSSPLAPNCLAHSSLPRHHTCNKGIKTT